MSRESRTANVIKNSVASVAVRGISILSQFVLRTVFIRVLGREYAGVAGLFSDVLNVLSLVELGLDISMVHALCEPIAQGKSECVGALTAFYRRAFAVIGAVVLAVGCCIAPFAGSIAGNAYGIDENISVIFLAYTAVTSVSYFFVCGSVLIKAAQKNRIISAVDAVCRLGECVFSVVLLSTLKNFYCYLGVRFVFCVGRNIFLSGTARRLFPEYFRHDRITLSVEDKRALRRDFLCLTAYDISGTVINSTDSIFITAFAGTGEVAVVGNFILIINSVKSFIEQAVSAARPSICDLAVSASPEKQERIFFRMNFIAFYFACICSTCLYTLLNVFIGDVWFDPSYKLPQGVVALLTLNFFLAVTVYPVESFRTANGLFVHGWKRPLVTAGINLLLDIVLGRSFGTLGIFAATAAARILTQIWYDPYLLYKSVFTGRLRRYFALLAAEIITVFACCVVSSTLAGMIKFDNAYVVFVLRAIISFTVANAVIGVLFGKKLYSLLRMIKK